jgi:methylmalonyl-CoA mutase cobalamin-binding domain/chain
VAAEVSKLASQTRDLSDTIAADVDSIWVGLEKTSEEFAANRELFGKAESSIQALSQASDGIARETDVLGDVSGQMEVIAYRQVGLQEHLENAARHSEAIEQASTILIAELRKTSHQLDSLWEQSLPSGQQIIVRDLQQFEESFYKALRDDMPGQAKSSVDAALAAKLHPQQILERIAEASARLDLQHSGKELPLETVFRHGQILQDALEKLEPLVEEETSPNRPTVVMGNAFEDYHDCGRRLVVIGLRAAGFRVVDLGLSVKNETFVETAIREGARVIGVSSLLLHTAKWIPLLKDELKKRGRSDIKVIAGGAPFLVDPRLRDRFGADGVGRSPGEAVRLARALVAGGAL